MDTHCGSLISQQPLVDLLVARIAADQAVIAEKFESPWGWEVLRHLPSLSARRCAHGRYSPRQ